MGIAGQRQAPPAGRRSGRCSQSCHLPHTTETRVHTSMLREAAAVAAASSLQVRRVDESCHANRAQQKTFFPQTVLSECRRAASSELRARLWLNS